MGYSGPSLRLTTKRYYPWIVWGLGAAFFFSEYFARVAPSVMIPLLMRDFNVNALALGSLSALFYYAYISMQLPVGVLVDRFGPHKLLTLNAMICGIGSLLFAMAPNIVVADIGRLLMGFGAAFAFVGSLKLVAVWFPTKRFGLLAGLTQALGMFGAAFGEAPMAIIIAGLGWRYTMVLVAIIFFTLAVLIGFIVMDYPRNYPKYKIKGAKELNLLKSIKIVLVNKYSWINAAASGCLYAPTAIFAELWGEQYLEHAYALSTDVSASLTSTIFIGWVFGGPLAGWLSDSIGKRRPVIMASALLGMILMVIIFYSPPMPLFLLYVIMFLYGLTNAGVSITYAVASEINPRRVAGTSMAFANMASVIIGAIFQPLVGLFLQLQWTGDKVNGIPVYTVLEYKEALIMLPAFSLLAFIFAYFIRETNCRPSIY